MLGNIINLYYRGLSIRRWNNYPRIEEFMETEHISLILHLSYIITKILQEKGLNIDLVYIYKNIFWSSFFTFIYSDINYDVKKYLKENYYGTYENLWKQIYNFFDSLNLPENLANDYKIIFSSKIRNNLFEDKYYIENEIISLAKNMVILFEIGTNVTFYPNIYQNIYSRVEKNIKSISNDIGFDDLDLIFDYANFLISLKFAYRWNRLNRIYPISVLSHLFLVFSFSYIIGTLKGFNSKKLEKICSISIMHDLPEALTGDIITPTKKAVGNFKKIIEEVESKLVYEKILSKFSNYSFSKELENYILFPFDDEIGKIAKISDNLSAMFEAKIEENEKFKKIYYDIKKYLWTLNDRELDYILKFGVDYFDDDIETKWKKFIGISK